MNLGLNCVTNQMTQAMHGNCLTMYPLFPRVLFRNLDKDSIVIVLLFHIFTCFRPILNKLALQSISLAQ